MSDDAHRPRWALVALLAGVGLVVVIALIAVFVRGGTTQFDADTPEGVVQRYSEAVIAGDRSKALTYVSAAVADDCRDPGSGVEDYRVTLLKTDEASRTARVFVNITTIYGSGPLGPSEYESEETFRLEQFRGDWLIASAPWQLAICEGLT